MGLPLRILLVEDRPDDAELMVAALRSSGLEVQAVRVDTYDDLDRGLTDDPDVLITDWNLPGMLVTQVLRRARLAVPDLPVIVVSGVVDEADAVRLLALGATDLLLKDRLARLGPAVAAAVSTRRTLRRGREAAERARWSWGLLSELVERSPAAICVRSVDDTVLLANALYRSLEADGGDAVVPWPALPHAPVAAYPRATEREVEIGDRTYLAIGFPLALNGPPSAQAMILLDVSRQKAIERQLTATRAELALQARELRASNIELLELDRLKSDLVSTVSHELRTPLTSILGYAELLEERWPADEDATGREMLRVVSRNSRRLLDLADNLLLLARADQATADQAAAAGTPGRREQVDVADLVAGVVAVMRPAAESAGVDLRADVRGTVPAVRGDRASLERALLNLVSNAVKFSRPGDRVRVRARPGEQAVVEVVDHGAGLPPHEIARLGTRFFRGEAARAGHVAGTGLGVSVVAAIAHEHGGSLSYHETPGGGLTARLRLPLAG